MMKGKFSGIVLATDLDGTFLTKDPEGRRRNLEAIEYFKENGLNISFKESSELHGYCVSIKEVK